MRDAPGEVNKGQGTRPTHGAWSATDGQMHGSDCAHLSSADVIEERTFAKRGMVDNALKFSNIACKRTAECMNARTPDSENELCLVNMEV